jgi:hypothetical protein
VQAVTQDGSHIVVHVSTTLFVQPLAHAVAVVTSHEKEAPLHFEEQSSPVSISQLPLICVTAARASGANARNVAAAARPSEALTEINM